MPNKAYTNVESKVYEELKTAKECLVLLQGTDMFVWLLLSLPNGWFGYSNGAADGYILNPRIMFSNGKIYMNSSNRIGSAADLVKIEEIRYR